MAKGGFTKIANLLVLLGGIIGLLLGILEILGYGFGFLHLWAWGGLIDGIILILLSLIVLATNGAVKIQKLKFASNWIVYLILGILMLLFGGEWGGILVIIGAILLLL